MIPEHLTALSLGCAQLGNLYRAIPDEQAQATVDAAWDAGIRYFDTAPHYGLGLSERRLGEALASRPRDQYVLSTKVGRLLEPLPGPFRGTDTEGFAVPAPDVPARWAVDPAEGSGPAASGRAGAHGLRNTSQRTVMPPGASVGRVPG